jgi:hypothetical protein
MSLLWHLIGLRGLYGTELRSNLGHCSGGFIDGLAGLTKVGELSLVAAYVLLRASILIKYNQVGVYRIATRQQMSQLGH